MVLQAVKPNNNRDIHAYFMAFFSDD
jgi:hypothetical protein